MKWLSMGLIVAGSLLISLATPQKSYVQSLQQPDVRSLVRAIVGVVEPDIQRHRTVAQARVDGPRQIHVGSFVYGIQGALGQTVSIGDVLAASGPGAVPATREEAVSRAGVRGGGTFIQLDSLRTLHQGSERLVGTVQWIFTALPRGGYPYEIAYRFCLDPSAEGWTVVGSREVPPVQFPTPPAPLDCELQ